MKRALSLLLSGLLSGLFASSAASPDMVSAGPENRMVASAVNGNRVAWVVNAGEVGKLRVATLAGGAVSGEVGVFDALDVASVALSADGNTMAVVIEVDGGNQLWVSDPVGTNAVMLYSAKQVLHPSVSRDGSTIAVSAAEGTNRPHVVVLARAGGVKAELKNTAPAYHPSLSPDGRFVAYASGTRNLDTKYPLMIADTLGGEPVQVQKGVTQGGVLDVRWAPDGRAIGATVWTGEHYGVGLFDPWGVYSSNVTFLDQPEGQRNGLVYRFAGFVDNTDMLALLDDNNANASKLRTFTASVSAANPSTGSRDVTAPMSGDLLGAAVAFAGSTTITSGGPLKITAVDQKAGYGEVRLSTPEKPGYQHVSVTWNTPNGTGGTAFEGYSRTGRFGPLTPGMTYTVRAVVRDLDGTDHEARTYVFRAPDATRMTARITRTQTSSRRALWQAKGTLSDAASRFALPYGEVQLLIKPAGASEYEIVDTAVSDAKGRFALKASGALTGYAKVQFNGDNDKFGSEKQLRYAPQKVSVKAPRRAAKGAKVTVTATLSAKATGAQAVLERKRGSKWIAQKTAEVKNRTASFTVVGTTTMTWRVRVLDNAWTKAAASAPFEIAVRR